MNHTGDQFHAGDSVSENDIELNVNQVRRIRSQQLTQKDILASDNVSVSSRANNVKAIQQELEEVNLRFQAINADALIRLLTHIDILAFIFSVIPVVMKRYSILELTISIGIRVLTILLLIGRHLYKT